MAIRRKEDIMEQETVDLQLQILDFDNDPIAADELDTLTLTLYDEESGEIINDRDHVNILNANGGAVDDEGILTMSLESDDTVLVGDPTAAYSTDLFNYFRRSRPWLQRTSYGQLYREWHIALFEWTWTDGSVSPAVTRTSRREIAHRIRNLEKVPAA